MMETIGNHVTSHLRHVKLYEKAKRSKKKLDSLVDASTSLSAQIDPRSLAKLIMHETSSLLNCERCSLFFCDYENRTLKPMTLGGEVDIQIALDEGIAGFV